MHGTYNENYANIKRPCNATFNNNPYITASHQAALIVHVSVKVLLGLGSDVEILHCFPDVRSLVEPVARIEEIQRVQFVLF